MTLLEILSILAVLLGLAFLIWPLCSWATRPPRD